MHVSFKQMRFSPESLTAEAFQPFGKVLEHSGAGRRHMIESNFSQKEEDLRQAIWVSRLPDAARALGLDTAPSYVFETMIVRGDVPEIALRKYLRR